MIKITTPEINKELAEEIGIHIGDGSLGIYNKTGHYDYTICGGLEDEIYLSEFVTPLIYKIYGLKPYLKYSKKDGSISLVYVSKELVLWKKTIGLPVGPKDNISIPSVILNSDFILDCVRGIFDTDGTISFKKRDKEENYYPVIKVTSKSKILIEQIEKILKSKGINSSIQYDVSRQDKRGFKTIDNQLFINGEKNLEKFINIIGFSNIKHITKYLVWKKLGQLKPYTSLDERLEMLPELSRGN